MNILISFLKSVIISFIPPLGIKIAKENEDLGTKSYILYLAILIAIPGFFAMVFSSVLLLSNPDKYFDDFPEFKITDDTVETEAECDSQYKDEESELELYFFHCSETIPNNLPVNSVIVSRKFISVVKKSGEIRSFPAGTFGDWEFSQQNIQKWIKYWTIPLVISAFVLLILIQFFLRSIEIFIFSLFYNLSKKIKNAESTHKNSVNRIVFLAIIPSALIDAFFGKIEIIQSLTYYIFIFYIIVYFVLLLKDLKNNKPNVV